MSLDRRRARCAGHLLLASALATVCACGGQDIAQDAGSVADAAADARDGGPSDVGPADTGADDVGVEPDSGPPEDSGPPDTGVREDAGELIDTGVEQDAGHPVDTGVEDASQPVDTGVELDAGQPDTGVELDAGYDADVTDAEAPDADLDAGFADSGGLDAGPTDGGPTPGFHFLTVMGDGELFVSGGVIGTCPPLNPFRVCTLEVQDGAFVDFGNTAPGHCYRNHTRVECGSGNGVYCYDDPTTGYAGCSGTLSGGMVLSYSDEYLGAFSGCYQPPPGCPSTITCGYFGLTDYCGSCTAGSTCIGDGSNASCLPYACPP